MTTPDEQPAERPATGERPGSYGEIAPGVPRYGQYAPEGWVPPTPPESVHTPAPAAASYPGFQGAPLSPDAKTPAAAPRPVALASRLIMLAGLLQALSGVLLLVVLFMPALRTTMTETLEAALPNDPAYAQMLADGSMMTTLLSISAIVSLLGAATYFWLAAKIRKGANWARITGLVLAVISLAALIQPNVFTLVQIGLGVIAIIIVFTAPAKDYFAKATHGKGPHGY